MNFSLVSAAATVSRQEAAERELLNTVADRLLEIADISNSVSWEDMCEQLVRYAMDLKEGNT